MKILGKNILITIEEKKETFTNDEPNKAVGIVYGIGEEVSLDIKIGDKIVFNPSAVIKIIEESWDVIPESAVICLNKEVN
jgi:co-chaperonin GroES (HSP10)